MWFAFSLLYALITSLHIPLIKKIASKTNSVLFIFIANLFIIPIMLGILLAFKGLPTVTYDFFIPMIIASLFDTTAFILSVCAFSNSSIALVVPLAAFNPVFTTILGALFLHEEPTFPKLIGIFVIVLGAYILNITDIKEGILTPFKKLYEVRGVRYFIIANLLWSFVPIFQKKAVQQTVPQSPEFVATIGTVLISLYVLPWILMKKENIISPIKKYKWWLLLGGILVTFQQFALQNAYVLGNVGYVTAVGKLSSVFIVIWGMLFFKEGRIKERLLGTIVMVIGTLLIVL